MPGPHYDDDTDPALFGGRKVRGARLRLAGHAHA
jgi:hypothetical protein